MNQSELVQVATAQMIRDELNDRYCGHGARGADSLRSKLDQKLLGAYEEGGIDRVRAKVNGETIAALSVVEGRPKEVKSIIVEDERALVEWLRTTDEGADVLKMLLCSRGRGPLMECCWTELEEVGCVPDGCRVNIRTEQGKPHTMLKVDHEAFARAVGSLPGAVALLDAGEVSE